MRRACTAPEKRPLASPSTRAGELELYRVDRDLLAGLVAALERRMSFALSVTDRHVYVSIGSETIEGTVSRVAIPGS